MTWSFWFSVPDPWLRPVWSLCLAVLALSCLGLFSRVTAVLALDHRRFHGPAAADRALWIRPDRVGAGVLPGCHGRQRPGGLSRSIHQTLAAGTCDGRPRPRACGKYGASGHARSAGCASGVGVGEPGLRLIQIHLVVIYAMAGLAKVQGLSWWNGTAIWKTMATGEFVVLDFTALAAWPLLINLVTHASLALELLYPVLIWVKIVRPLLLAGVMALHLGIAVMSPGLTEFALVMIAANLAFVSGPWLRRLVTGSNQPNMRVLYDGACPRCRASMALIAAADPDRVVDPVDLTAVDLATSIAA